MSWNWRDLVVLTLLLFGAAMMVTDRCTNTAGRG